MRVQIKPRDDGGRGPSNRNQGKKAGKVLEKYQAYLALTAREKTSKE